MKKVLSGNNWNWPQTINAVIPIEIDFQTDKLEMKIDA